MNAMQDRLYRELDNLRETIEKIAEKYVDARRKTMESARASKDFDEAVKTRESMVLAMVSMELDDKNKPRYSNAESRKAELISRLVNDDEYQTLKDRLFTQQGLKMNADLDVMGLEDQWKALSAVKEILIAQSNLLTAS